MAKQPATIYVCQNCGGQSRKWLGQCPECQQWNTLVGKGGAVGRQLDFLVQELLREANTIGSKCNDAEVAQIVVEIKTRIERLREQVQNVE